MPSSLIIGALGLEAGGLAAGLITLGVRLAEVYAISSLLNKNQDQPTTTSANQGGQVQLPPATNNKLPVVYGNQFVSGIIVDAMLSTDQQKMWYVIAFSETTDSGDISFGDIYWDDKLLVFNPALPHSISCWYVPATSGGAEANSRVTGVAGKIGMWFYNNGSHSEAYHHCLDTFGTDPNPQPEPKKSNIDAISVLQDASIPAEIQWTANNLMSNTVFAILGVQYDSNHTLINLGQIKAEILNTLGTNRDINNAVTTNMGPGSVIKDYLLNNRYGCGLDIANINTTSLDNLDEYSKEQLTLKLTDGTYATNDRYSINGILNTGNDCMVNLNSLADCVDSWIQWDERDAKWGVVMNRSHFEETGQDLIDIVPITKDQIIGGININPTDLKTSANKLTVQFPSFKLENQTDYRYYDLPSYLKNANEPDNNLSVNYPFVDNEQQATWLGYKKLWSSREDLIINFTMDYSGIKIDAGDVIAINHEWYGWGPLPTNPANASRYFRVTQVKEAKDPSGFLSVQIAAMSYNDDIYTETDPGFFHITEFNNSLLKDPTIITLPGKPTIETFTTTNLMVVSSSVPSLGNVQAMEFWYGTTSTVTINNYALYETQHYVTTTTTNAYNIELYPNSYVEKINALNIPSGTYYWATRALGSISASDFSPVSDPVVWTYNPFLGTGPGSIPGYTIKDGSISGSKVITGDPATVGTSASPGFFDTLGPLAFAGLGLAAINYGYKNGVFDGLLPDSWKAKGGGNDEGDTQVDPTTTMTYDNGLTASNPQVGDSVTIVADSTPSQSSPPQTYADNGFNDYGGGGDSYFDWA